MSDTDFVPSTLVTSAWLNEINDHVHHDTVTSDRSYVHGANVISTVQSGTGAVTTDLQTRARLVVYAQDFMTAAQKADVLANTGLVDVIDAIRAADTELVTRGGGVLRLPAGTYRTSLRYQPSSDVTVEGDGIGATLIKNVAVNSPDNIAIDIRGTLSGTTYAINAPTEGALTVTTTTAGDAGNFTAGDFIALHGAISGNDYVPLWIGTVSTAVAGTGVITLTERLLRGGATITSVQKVTSLKQNVAVRRLSITQSSDVALIAKYAKGVTIEDVDASTGITSAGIVAVGCREITIQRCKSYIAISLHSCTNPKIIDNRLANADLVFEGGCEGGTVALNTIANPTSTAITINTGSQRLQIVNNSIESLGTNVDGILIAGNGANEGENTIAFNKIDGAGSSANAVTIGGTRSDNNVVAFNYIRNISTGIRANTNSAGQRIFGNYFASTVTTNTTITGGATTSGSMDTPAAIVGDWWTINGANSVTGKFGVHALRSGGMYWDVSTSRDHSWRVNGTDVLIMNAASGLQMTGIRVQGAQGATVSSANNVTLGAAGNRFQISGTTQINLIDNTNWQGGAIVTLHLQGSVTVKHNQAASTTFMPIMLAGAVDFSGTANDQLTLQYDSTDTKWYEIGRTVI